MCELCRLHLSEQGERLILALDKHVGKTLYIRLDNVARINTVALFALGLDQWNDREVELFVSGRAEDAHASALVTQYGLDITKKALMECIECDNLIEKAKNESSADAAPGRH